MTIIYHDDESIECITSASHYIMYPDGTTKYFRWNGCVEL